MDCSYDRVLPPVLKGALHKGEAAEKTAIIPVAPGEGSPEVSVEAVIVEGLAETVLQRSTFLVRRLLAERMRSLMPRSRRVSYLFVNGIGNTKGKIQESAARLSAELQHDVAVYQYPTKGIVRDLCGALRVKAGWYDPELAERITQMVDGVGGPNGDGVLCVVGHSLGGAILNETLKRIPSQYQERMVMVTAGSPIKIDGGLELAAGMTIAHKNDPVPKMQRGGKSSWNERRLRGEERGLKAHGFTQVYVTVVAEEVRGLVSEVKESDRERAAARSSRFLSRGVFWSVGGAMMVPTAPKITVRS